MASPSSATGSVLYQPNGPQNVYWVYNNFATLTAFIATQTTIPNWTILIDGSFSSGIVSIPAGTYPMPPMVNFEAVAESSDPNGYPTLSGTNVVFTGVNAIKFTNIPSVQFNNSIPLLTLSDAGTPNLVLDNSNLMPGGTAAMIALTNGTVLHMISLKGSIVGTQSVGPSQPVFSVDATSTLNIELYDTTELLANSILLSSGGTLNIGQVDSALVDRSFRRMSGVTIGLQSNANAVLYSPSRSSHSSTVPRALDSLFEAVARLEKKRCKKRCHRDRRSRCKRSRRRSSRKSSERS
jgi:hypothetical protein